MGNSLSSRPLAWSFPQGKYWKLIIFGTLLHKNIQRDSTNDQNQMLYFLFCYLLSLLQLISIANYFDDEFIFLMLKLYWSERWPHHPSQLPVSQLWFSAVDSVTMVCQKCNYEINSAPSLVHFQHKKDQVNPN